MALFHNGHLLDVRHITRLDMDMLFSMARDFKRLLEQRNAPPVLAGRIMGSLFFEPSTRTRMSFESAFLRLGGTVNHLGPTEYSSAQKGESFRDTVRIVQHYADVLVIRHPEPGRVQEAAELLQIPVINAGDGTGEHPTQALLDMFTLAEQRPIDGLSIAIIGDLKHSRTVHSLIQLFPLFQGVRLKLLAPPACALPAHLIAHLQQHKIAFTHEDALENAISNVDAVYVTRLQKERFSEADIPQGVPHYYRLDRNMIEQYARSDMLVLHPLPRVDELASDVDDLPGALYFEQASCGLFIRMALFAYLFGSQLNLSPYF